MTERDSEIEATRRGAKSLAFDRPDYALRHIPARLSTGLPGVDRVLGGGLVPGACVLLGHDRGAGATTLALQIAGEVARQGRRVLWCSDEMTRQDVIAHAKRVLGSLPAEIEVLGQDDDRPVTFDDYALAVVDSVQTEACRHHPRGRNVTMASIGRAVTAVDKKARAAGAAAILVSHKTKGGTLRGPRGMEHAVSVVADLRRGEGEDRTFSVERKNYHGKTPAEAHLVMTDRGLVERPSKKGG